MAERLQQRTKRVDRARATMTESAEVAAGTGRLVRIEAVPEAGRRADQLALVGHAIRIAIQARTLREIERIGDAVVVAVGREDPQVVVNAVRSLLHEEQPAGRRIGGHGFDLQSLRARDEHARAQHFVRNDVSAAIEGLQGRPGVVESDEHDAALAVEARGKDRQVGEEPDALGLAAVRGWVGEGADREPAGVCAIGGEDLHAERPDLVDRVQPARRQIDVGHEHDILQILDRRIDVDARRQQSSAREIVAVEELLAAADDQVAVGSDTDCGRVDREALGIEIEGIAESQWGRRIVVDHDRAHVGQAGDVSVRIQVESRLDDEVAIGVHRSGVHLPARDQKTSAVDQARALRIDDADLMGRVLRVGEAHRLEVVEALDRVGLAEQHGLAGMGRSGEEGECGKASRALEFHVGTRSWSEGP